MGNSPSSPPSSAAGLDHQAAALPLEPGAPNPRKKILLISPFFPPEVGSAAHLYYDLGRALRERGHEVTVLTGLPRYHVAGKRQEHRRRPFIYETYHGLKVLRVLNLDIPWNIPILRGIDQFFSALAAGVAGLWLPPFDAAMVYSPPLPLALATVALCRIRRRPLIVNVQDLFPQCAVDLGVLHNSGLVQIFKALEAFLYRHADLVAVHSEGNRRHVLKAGGKFGKVSVIHNWVDTEAIRPGSQNGLRASLGLEHRFIVSFAGIMGYSQDLETVLHSARILKAQKEIVFLLVGDGVEKPKLQKLARDHQLDNVLFLPMLPKEQYREVLAASDLCLATLRPEVKTPVVPSKILSIMAAGRPVLASLPLDGDASRLIAAAQCGMAISPSDPEAMARTILQFSCDPESREQMGDRGRRYAVQHFSLQQAAALIENRICRIPSLD